MGVLTEKIRDLGFDVTAVDIAGQPLKALRERGIVTKQDYVPKTLLEDGRFGLVVATDLIAEIPPTEYRLFFAEITRLLAREGRTVCSTSIDIYSENALQRFAQLAETELVIEAISKYVDLAIENADKKVDIIEVIILF
jgi:2-polyprenyl-3-methyl-5-hydroxy-6-metoxy-1,4-benzoquinol methylase